MSQENQSSATDQVSFENLEQEFAFTLPAEIEAPEAASAPVIDITTVATPEEKVEEQQPVVTISTETPSIYTNLVKKYIESGDWDDAVIKDGEEEVKISEMENISEEDFYKLLEDQKALKQEDIRDKYISVEGKTEEQKLIIEIVSNGGDLKEIFKTPEAMVKPFDEALGWDVENERHQETIAEQHYISLGNTPARAKILVEQDKKELVLDSVAKQVVEHHQKAYAENLKKINDDLVESKKAEQERVKAFRSELSKKYKETQVPDTLAKKLLDLATRETEEGFAIDAIYEQKMQDPAEAQEIVFFLADKEKYLQQKMLETKVNTQTSNMRVINRIPKDRDKSPAEAEQENSKGAFTFSLPAKP